MHMQLARLSASALVIALASAACKSTEGSDRAAQTALQVEAVGSVTGQTQLRLDQSLDALEQIAATADHNPKPAFDAFVTAFESFRAESAKFSREHGQLQSQMQTWFAEFSKRNATIQDAELRAQGEERLADLRGKSSAASERYEEVLTATRSFATRLGDLRIFLGNDLTPAAIETVGSRIKDTTKEGRQLAEKLGEYSKAAESIATPLRAAKQPAKVL